MANLEDFDFGRTQVPEPTLRSPSPGGGPPVGLIAGVALVVLALAALVYLAFRKPAPPPAPRPSPPAKAAASAAPPTPAPPLPPLDDSDSLVRELAKGLSSDPRVAGWLGLKGLVRTFTVVVQNVAEGESPRAHLGFLAPKGAFGAVRKQGQLVIDPRSYQRYDGFGDAVASLDAKGCAGVFERLEPLFEAAYRELGNPEGGFRATLARAIASLQQTPVVGGDVPVRPAARPVLVYEMADRRLESLSPAQKHLFRMGPRNVAKVQATLREFASALSLAAAPAAPAAP